MKSSTREDSLGRLVAFVGPELDAGLVLCAWGSFEEECVANGRFLEDHEIVRAPRAGLLMFEGWVHVGPDPDPDVSLAGQWRELTFWEVCQLRSGFSPFVDEV